MRWMLCLMLCCLLGVARIEAQPPDPEPLEAQPPDPEPPAQTEVMRVGADPLPFVDPLIWRLLDPYSTVSNFFGNYSANRWDALPDFVQGAKDTPALENAGNEFLKARGTMRLSVTNITPHIDGDDARVSYFVHSVDHLGSAMAWRESLQLHREDFLWNDRKGAPRKSSVWRIVPGAKRLIHTDDALGFFNRIATYVAYANELPSLLRQRQAGIQARALTLSLKQFLQDNNEIYALTAATFKEKLAMYMRNPAVLTAPGDPVGTQSFSFNDKIANLNIINKIGELDKLVVFYLGRNGKPEFRFDGQTIIGFADDHVEFVDEAKSKTLHWEP